MTLVGALLLLLVATPAVAHHVGTYTPRDNDVSANFKQLKYSIGARKFDVALRLYEEGALRRELLARAARLPAGLDGAVRGALERADADGAERGLMLFVVALTRDLALEAGRRLANARESAEARVAAARKFLEAIWRYYNLVDFAVTRRDARAATTVRLAFDEADGYVKASAPAPERLREPLHRIADALTGVIETSSQSARRDS